MPGAFDVEEMKLSTRVVQSTIPGRKGLKAQVLAANCLCAKVAAAVGRRGEGKGWRIERAFWRSEEGHRPGQTERGRGIVYP